MRLIWTMARKDLLRRLRQPMGILFVLSFPLVFSALLALSFGGGGGAMPKVQLLVEDRDESFLSGMLVSALGSEQAAAYIEATRVGVEGRERMERGEASALLVIPEGFADDLLEGTPITLTLVRNPAQGILPEIAEQGLRVLADVLSSGSWLLREPLEELGPLFARAQAPTGEQVAAVAMLFHQAIESSGELLMPPAIMLASVTAEEAEGQATGSMFGAIFLVVLPGISVWALFSLGDMAMRDILTESRQGTLRRQLGGPITSRHLVLSKALYSSVLCLISLVLLSAIGAVAIDGAIDLVAFAALSMALVLAVTGYASIVYGLAGTERQGATISSVLLLIFAFAGGSFVPLDSLPASLLRLSPFTPFYWGVSGYGKLLHDSGQMRDVLTNIGVLAAFGAILLLVGARLMDGRIRRGKLA